jgi:hypothetical protein
MSDAAELWELLPIEEVYYFFADVNQPGRWLIRTAEELQATWKLVPEGMPPPTVDFAREMLVCVTRGITGGSWPLISFDGYCLTAEAVEVIVRVTGPPSGYWSDSAGTFQFLLVGRMPRHDGRVEFTDRYAQAMTGWTDRDNRPK